MPSPKKGTNKNAYDKIREGLANANAGYANAVDDAARNYYLKVILGLDDELDALVRKNLTKRNTAYKNLTKSFTDTKATLQQIVADTKAFVKDAALALSIIAGLTKVLALL